MANPPPGPSLGRSAFVVLFTALLIFTAVLLVLSIPAGIYAVYSGTLSQTLTAGSLYPLYYLVGPLVEPGPNVGLGGAFGVLTFVFAAFIVYALLQRESVTGAVRGSFARGVGALASSPFIAAIIAVGVLSFGGTLIDEAVAAAGVPIGGLNPSVDPLYALMGLTYAPLVEEVGFRVVLIGVVALILSIGRPLKVALASLWRPSRAIEGMALGSGASVIIWAATGFSAVTFGACHVTCGPTWDIGKFPDAVFGGLVLGYLYVKYGLHVAVLAHWGLDFGGSAYSFFGQAYYGIPWYSSVQEYLGQYLVDEDMLYLFGLVSFLLVVYLGVMKLVALRSNGGMDEFDKGPSGGGGLEP